MKSCYFRGECSNATTKMRVGFFRSAGATPFVFAFKRSQAAISISTPSFITMPIACASIVRAKNGRSEQTALSNTSKWQRKKLRNSCFLHSISVIYRDTSISKEEKLLSMQQEHMHLYTASLQQSRAVFETVSQTGEKFSDLRVVFPYSRCNLQSSLHSSLDQLRNASESYYDSTRNAFYWTRDKLDSIAGLQDRLRSSLSDVAALLRLTGRVLAAYFLTAVPGVRLAG